MANQFYMKNRPAAAVYGLLICSFVITLALAGCNDQSTNSREAALQSEAHEAVQMATKADAAASPTQNAPLVQGEVRTLPCECSTAFGCVILVVRGEVVGGTGSDPIIGQKIIETRSCHRPTVAENVPGGVAMVPNQTNNTNVLAAENKQRPTGEGQTCRGVSGGSYATTECLHKDLAHQDKELNQSYKIVIGMLSQQEKTKLRNLQRNWIKDRDKRCETAAMADSMSTASTPNYLECMIKETKQRTGWLQRYR
jgi:uncharacterized protein YecT (DUF1311 family)